MVDIQCGECGDVVCVVLVQPHLLSSVFPERVEAVDKVLKDIRCELLRMFRQFLSNIQHRDVISRLGEGREFIHVLHLSVK